MADAFDVEAYLEEQTAKASKDETKVADRKEKDSRKGSRSRSRERRRDRSRDRRRDDSRDRRRRRSSSRSRDRDRRRRDSRSRSKDRQKERGRSDDRERRERSSEGKKTKEVLTEADKEELQRQKEIDDLTKDQRTIFVGQLTKKVGERDLERFFGQIGKVRSVIMIRDKHSGVHKGFGYVEMADLEKIPDCLLFHNVVPDFQKFPILVKASEAEKNFLAKRDPFNLKNAHDPENDPETRVYVGNIHVGLDEPALKLVLEQFGTVESVKIHRDHLGTSKGFAFVKYTTRESARICMNTLGGMELAGRALKVGPVTDYKPNVPSTGSSAADTVPMSNFNANYGADASGNWKLDADEGSAGMALNAQSRQMLMAKLAQTAGIEVPVLQVPQIPLPNAVTSASNTMQTGPAGNPSVCFKINNMFDPASETGPDWDEEIRDDVGEECSRYGSVELCKVDKKNPGGLVFVKMGGLEGALSAANALHGRYFAGRMITVNFLDPMTFRDLVA